MTRKKPPQTRHGITHKIELPDANVYVTLNRDADGHPCDLLITLNNENDAAPIDPAHQAWANIAATFIGMLFQRVVSIGKVAQTLRGYAFEPAGMMGPGGARSIPDAIGKWLETQEEEA